MKYLYLIVLVSSIFVSCKKNEKPSIEGLDFSKPAAFGGSYLTGMQNGAVSNRGQNYSIPQLIFEKITEYGGGSYSPVLIGSDEGIGLHSKPWEGIYQQALKLGTRTDCNGEESLGPVRTLYETVPTGVFQPQNLNVVQDFSVPHLSIRDIESPTFGAPSQNNLFYHFKASDPGTSTLISDYQNYNASFTIAQLGMDDIFNYASKGGYQVSIPPVDSFELALDNFLQVATANGGKGVLLNIPEFDRYPFFNLIPKSGGDLRQGQADSLNNLFSNIGAPHIQYGTGANNFIITDPLYPAGARQITDEEFVLLNVPLDSIKCYLYGVVLPPLHERYVLDSAEIEMIREMTLAYNQIIEKKAAEYDFALADLNGLVAKMETGIKWHGVDFDLEFVTGGFLSLDGIHPNEKGYAMIASNIITSINTYYGTSIPFINCLDCNGVLFP